MSSVGFRPPQFSEDLAWLPTCLHHPQLQSSSSSSSANRIIDHPITSYQSFNDLINVGDGGKDVDENYNKLCHLFLSGEEASQISVAPSSRNVLHLRLHLSLDGDDSQYSQSQRLHKSQALHGSSRVMSLQQVETSAGTGEALQLKMVHDGSGVDLSPLTSKPISAERSDPQFQTDDKDSGRQYNEIISRNDCETHCLPVSTIPVTTENAGQPPCSNCMDTVCHYEEKYHIRHIKDADMDDAIELSISASEALVIHELMKTGSASDALPMQAILDAALHMKQARLEALEDAFSCPSDEDDDFDFLSDLDDSIMSDAFVDVGLSFSAPKYQHVHVSDISQVEDTPVLENNNVDKGSKCVHLMGQRDNAADDSDLCLNPNNRACPESDPILSESTQKISQVWATPQDQVDVNLAGACISENAGGEDKVSCSFSNRFSSRWLGGWSVEDGDASAKLKQNSPKSVPKFFVRETSFLSESADVAADENSFVQKHEMSSKICSQSSVQGLHDKASEGILISQEVRSSDQSLVDPLCSVVPCSISLESASTHVPQNHGGKTVDAENFFSPKSDTGMENFLGILHQNAEAVNINSHAVPGITGKCSEAPIRRQMASLKTYSMLLPNCDAILEGQGPSHDRQLSLEYVGKLSSHQEKGYIRSPAQRNSKGLLPFRSVCETVDRDNEENQDATSMKNLVAETKNQTRSHDQPTKDSTKMNAQPSMLRRSPLVLNRRTHCRLQASELFVGNLTGERDPEQAVAQKNMSELHPSKNVENLQVKLKNSHSTTWNSVRKRVCFSEVDLHQNKDLRKPQSLCKYCTTTRACKKRKYCSTCSDYQTEDVKSCFTSQMKDVKRLIFHGLEFLLTGFSSKKEKDIIELIQIYGGMILLDVPSPASRLKRISRSNFQKLPIVICSKKLQTAKFLYGCVVSTLILKLKWLTDSIEAGSVVPPEKYMIISNQAYLKCTRIRKSVCCNHRKLIFNRIGIVFHGKQRFCTKLAAIVKHGGGQVFKTLRSLVQSLDTETTSIGVIVTEDESRALRHLRHCASERKIPMMPASWIAKSLHLGMLLPFKEKDDIPSTIKEPKFAASVDWSQEI